MTSWQAEWELSALAATEASKATTNAHNALTRFLQDGDPTELRACLHQARRARHMKAQHRHHLLAAQDLASKEHRP